MLVVQALVSEDAAPAVCPLIRKEEKGWVRRTGGEEEERANIFDRIVLNTPLTEMTGSVHASRSYPTPMKQA